MKKSEGSEFWDFEGRVAVKNGKIVSVKVFSPSIDSYAEELAESRIASNGHKGLIDLLAISEVQSEFVALIEGKVIRNRGEEVVYISRVRVEMPR